MADEMDFELIAKLEALATEQGTVVRALKKAKADKKEIAAAVAELKKRKEAVEAAKPKPWDRGPFEDLLKRRFVYAPAFEVYGGVAGFYDYGPIGCAIKANFQTAWRDHFVLQENMLEIDTPAMTPDFVLKASGHVDRFTDIMVKDMATGECIRADHLLEDVMEKRMMDTKITAEERAEAKLIHAKADAYTPEELQELFARFKIASPSGNPLSPPEDFNMMFKSSIGPSGHLTGFLRPETAQGIFLAFPRLYEFNNRRLPFAGAQIGLAFRNEISPRNGLLRVREFQMAEIEHFLDPLDKSCKSFPSVAELEVPLLSAESQENGTPIKSRKLGEAVAEGLIDNETLGYFVGRIYLFLLKVGADPKRVRFRQHLKNEMAHYAADCWDAELETSLGWVECVGCADRSAFDLDAHSVGSSKKLEASVVLKEPIVTDKVSVLPAKKKMGPKYKKAAGAIMKYLADLSNDEALAIEKSLLDTQAATITVDGTEYTLDPEVASIEKKQVKVFERKFTPSVIEPSFGIGRIIYCVLEHVYDCREGDAARGYLKLPPVMAPVKCALLPLSNNPDFEPLLDKLQTTLKFAGVSSRRDDSSVSLGRRYARTDEIAVPFAITVDFASVKGDLVNTVTLRERDSMKQIRLPVEDCPDLLASLSNGNTQWDQAIEKYGLTNTGSDGADK